MITVTVDGDEVRLWQSGARSGLTAMPNRHSVQPDDPAVARHLSGPAEDLLTRRGVLQVHSGPAQRARTGAARIWSDSSSTGR